MRPRTFTLTRSKPPAWRARRSRAAGLALLELIVVLALLALLVSFAFALGRPSHARRAASAMRTAILWARTEAMWGGVAVSVTEATSGQGVVVRTAPDPANPCAAGTVLTRVLLAEFPGVRLEAGLPRGLVWLPSGSGRSCAGGGVISGTMVLADGRASVRLIISALGRVRLEAP